MSANTRSQQVEAHRRLRILFVDDEESLQEFMRAELPRLGHEVVVCPDGRSALKALQTATFDAAILDLRMPDMTGIDVLEKLKQLSPDTEAVMMTGYASKETAIEALRLGAFDYITKPCPLSEIEAILGRIAERRELISRNVALESRLKAKEGPGILIGHSPAMLPVHRLIAQVGPTDSTVLIQGETGTGKELAAQSVHLSSKRKDMPFVPVNCGAIPDNLVESELFGHRKGAFTGADRDRKGLFEAANGGTVFLDEFGELNKGVQVKLLRFLESGEIRRLGETDALRLDVRVICATNKDLPTLIAGGDFREDLYYRINTFVIRLPSLRERSSDIAELALHLLARAARRPLDQVQGLLSSAAAHALAQYDWPGNVRQLANAMEYALIMSGGQPIHPEHLPGDVRQLARPARPATLSFPTLAVAPAPVYADDAPRTLHMIEMEHILRVLAKNNGNKPATAAELGISLKTLYNKLNKLEEERRAAG